MPRVNTTLPADSIEFYPSPTWPQIFVCGTYQLDALPGTLDNEPGNEAASSANPQRRWGECLVFEVNDGSDECTQLQAITMPAVLDMKWSSNLLAIADAEGNVVLHRWQDESQRLHHVQSLSCIPNAPNLICLSLDWAKVRSEQSSDKISVSLSDGSVLIARQSAAEMTVTDIWQAHDFEPWITAWDRWDTNVLYTGGDDCSLKVWDLRAGFTRPVFINKRFDAGVTTMQSNTHIEHILAVGSYDSTVRVFDMRQPLQTVAQADVGGGAWRVKWHPGSNRKQHLLVACMHDGFKVIDFEPLNLHSSKLSPNWAILARFDEHESLAYGVDWSHGPANREGTLVASCSFYDHSLHLWRT